MVLAVTVAFLPLAGLGHHHEPFGPVSPHVEPAQRDSGRPVSDVCIACMARQAPSSVTIAVVVAAAPPAAPESTEIPSDRAPRCSSSTPESARAPPVLLDGRV